MRIIQSTLAMAMVLCEVANAADGAHELQTLAEQSDYRQTGRYDEVVRLCAAYQRNWPKQARCFEFGRTPEGRAMLGLAISSDGSLDAKTNRDRARPVFLVQGGIHAGEIDGKDAGFLAVRHLLEGRTAKESLAKVTVVFVPIFNVDGHERFGPNNRPNQIGPEEMGWRTTAQNLNLNRDYVKAEAPEMQAMLRLLNEWDPIVYADLHVTDGAEFQHDISINVSPTLAGDEPLKRAGISLRDALMLELKAQGSLPVNFYPSFIKNDDPASGFAVSISPPRFSHEYWARRNRIGVLVETHSWKDYKTRVRSTYHSIVGLVTQIARHGAEWASIAKGLDKRAAQSTGREVVFAYANTAHVSNLEFRGYRYSRTPSSISGALMTKYDRTRPEIWRVPLFDQVQPVVSEKAPRVGYMIPAAWASMAAEKLALHAVAFTRVESAVGASAVRTFRATSSQPATTSSEGRAGLSVEGTWENESRPIGAGSLFVPSAQPNSELAVLLLEPKSPDSLLSWGFFTSAFERKEYMEAYVAEQVALEMLKKDDALRAEFERRLKEDAAFAGSAQARLDFFYRRHASWDEQYNLYPVLRLEEPVAGL